MLQRLRREPELPVLGVLLLAAVAAPPLLGQRIGASDKTVTSYHHVVRVDKERRRGLDLVKGWLALDADLFHEFSRLPGS